MNILCARCKFFRDTLLDIHAKPAEGALENTKEAAAQQDRSSEVHIYVEVDDVPYEVFYQLLVYLYTGEVHFCDPSKLVNHIPASSHLLFITFSFF